MRRHVFGSTLLVASALALSPAFGQDQGQGQGQQGQGQGQQGQGQGQGGQGQGRFGGRGGFQSTIDQIKDKDVVGLTDDQVTKGKALEETMRADMQKLRDDMQNGGDRTAMRDKMTALRDKLRADIKALLTPEQQPKFDDWVKKEDERRANRGGMGRGGNGGRPDPARNNQRLLDQAEKDLNLTSEEKAAVLPLVKALLEARSAAQTAQDKRTQELQDFLKNKTGSSDSEKSEIADKLKEIRKANDAEQDKVKKAEAALLEVLAPENEARLVALRILK